MTKAWRIHALGGPEVMRFEDIEVGAPGPGQVRMRNTAIAVNFRDIYARNGMHAIAGLPSGMGIESAGVVEAVGPDVKDVAVGQRIACVAGPDSAYAEARLVPAARVVPLPADIDERLAAAMMIRGMTARYLVRETWPVAAGDAVLVHAAAGGVGLILAQWAKSLGATVIGTVGSDAKVALARSCGCDHVIVYTREDFVARVKEITGGRGVSVAYDAVGKTTFEGSLRCLRPRGLLASYGEASGEPDPLPPRQLGLLGSVYLTHPSLPHYTATREALLANAHDLFEAVRTGRVRIETGHTYPLAEAQQAHRDMEARRTTGSVVLVP